MKRWLALCLLLGWLLGLSACQPAPEIQAPTVPPMGPRPMRAPRRMMLPRGTSDVAETEALGDEEATVLEPGENDVTPAEAAAGIEIPDMPEPPEF